MKLSLFAALVCVVGCSGNYGSLSNPPPDDLGPGPDASPPQDAHPYMGPICCQVMHDTVDDPVWNMGLYGCDTDGGLSVGTEAPWVCNVNDAGLCGGNTGIECLSCDQPQCHVGMACLGVNGTGTVTDCQPGSE